MKGRSNQRRDALEARQRRRWTLSIIGAGVLMGYFTYSFFFDAMGVMKYLNMKRTQAQIAEEIKVLEAKNARLKKDIEAVKHDPATLEQLARERLGMVQQDETVFLLVPDAAGRP